MSISVVNKPGMLQTIDRAVRKELRGPGQEAVWDAVLNDPGLLNPSARGMGIDQQPLAEAISRMTGTEISRQVAGRTFRDKVLPAMERALANDERLQQTLMKDRDIQQALYKEQLLDKAELARLEVRVKELEAQGVPRDPNYLPEDVDPDLAHSKAYVEAHQGEFYADDDSPQESGMGLWSLLFFAFIGTTIYSSFMRRY